MSIPQFTPDVRRTIQNLEDGLARVKADLLALQTSPGGGANDGSTHVHTQSIPSSTWTINHNLARYPSVTVVDSTGRVLFAAVEYVNQNTITITFGGSTAGQAFLN